VLPPVIVRWESAFPVRLEEQKAAEIGTPPLDSDDYAIAIYNIPTPDQWNLARELKGISCPKRAGKKDLKPSRIKILQNDDGTATLIYLFSRASGITRKDETVLFVARSVVCSCPNISSPPTCKSTGNLSFCCPRGASLNG
jgi:hypothetical protein